MESEIIIKSTKFEGDVYEYIYDSFNIHAESVTGIKNYWRNESAFVAQDVDKLVGFIFFEICGGQLEVKQLYVLAEYIGQGIGKKLLNKAFDFAKEVGSVFVYLSTMSFHNVEFYKSQGFEEDYRMEGFKGGHCCVHMHKNV